MGMGEENIREHALGLTGPEMQEITQEHGNEGSNGLQRTPCHLAIEKLFSINSEKMEY